VPRVSQEHKLQDQGTTAKSGLTKELACVDGYEVRQLWACLFRFLRLACTLAVAPPPTAEPSAARAELLDVLREEERL
jgi:hypothetical protein